MPLPLPVHDPEFVRRTAREVLSGARYGELRRTWVEQAVDRARAWLGDLLAGVLAAETAGIAAWALLGAALAVILALAGRYLLGIRSEPRRVPVGFDQIGRSAADWQAEAEAAEEAGELRTAVQAHYRALIAALASRGLVEEVAGRTVGEYRRAVAHSAPASRDGFETASDVFEGVWYGGEPADRDRLERLRAAAASARRAVAA